MKQVKNLASIPTHQYTEEQWSARSDAWNLAEAERVKADPERYKKARLWAAVLLETESEEMEALKKIANA